MPSTRLYCATSLSSWDLMAANMAAKKRGVVLISGNGSNLQALIDAIGSGALPLEIALVVSNRKGAYGLERAQAAKIPTLVFPLKPYKDAGKSRAEYDEALAAHVADACPDVIVLAGFMHILSPAFLGRFADIVINLHPALPGQFDGANAIQRAFEAYQAGECTHTGLMVHMVTEHVDQGRVLLTERVAIYPGDTLQDLEARMHAAEHAALVRAVRGFLTGGA